MKPQLDIQFPLKRQWNYWFGKQYEAREGEYLVNHARTGIVMALRAALPKGGRVGVVAYNCYTVANAVVSAGCVPFFVDVTEKLTIDIESVPVDLDAIVVTNLFGIRNDVEAIRKKCPGAIIIVDNAHGYGLPVEGDFTVYSINQGKFPALGPGGILCVGTKTQINTACADINIDKEVTKNDESELACSNSTSIDPKSAQEQALGQPSAQSCSVLLTDSSEKKYQKISKNIIAAIEEQYAKMPGYGFVGEVKLFAQMLVKAIAYSRCFYWIVMKLKKSANPDVHEKVTMRKMAKGVRRLYKAWLPKAEEEIEMQRRNAEEIGKWSMVNGKCFAGDNAFMAIVKCEDPIVLKAAYAAKGVETETHFKNAIVWAKQYGYVEGSCPHAEELTKHLLMIPTYVKIDD